MYLPYCQSSLLLACETCCSTLKWFFGFQTKRASDHAPPWKQVHSQNHIVQQSIDSKISRQETSKTIRMRVAHHWLKGDDTYWGKARLEEHSNCIEGVGEDPALQVPAVTVMGDFPYWSRLQNSWPTQVETLLFPTPALGKTSRKSPTAQQPEHCHRECHGGHAETDQVVPTGQTRPQWSKFPYQCPPLKLIANGLWKEMDHLPVPSRISGEKSLVWGIELTRGNFHVLRYFALELFGDAWMNRIPSSFLKCCRAEPATPLDQTPHETGHYWVDIGSTF